MVQDTAAQESFAVYLEKVLVGRRGFVTPVSDLLAPLMGACDRVLVRTDAPLMQVACIVDRDTRPDARFSMSPADVEALAWAWIGATERAGRRKPRIVITIYEVGSKIPASDEELRLAAYMGSPRLSRGPVIQAVLVDAERRLAWDNARRILGQPLAFRWLRRLLARPRLSERELAIGAVAADIGRFPTLTTVILVVLVALFGAEVLLPIAPFTGLLKADIRTLVAFGGVDRHLVLAQGQWWRLATAPLLHADAMHILFNGWALWLIGSLSERLMGPAWFAATFAVAALSGSALSIVVNPANILSVGASGAIVGLFTATYTLSFRLPAGALRSRLQSRTLGMLAPALIPFLSSTQNGVVDYGAHGGGAAGGLAMGLLMLWVWPKSLPRPRLALAAGAVAVCCLMLAMAAAVPDLANYRVVSLAQNLFEPFPKNDAQAREQSADMIAAKPHDPRARLAHAAQLIAAHDLERAEADLRSGLGETDLLDLIDPPHYADRMRILLGAVLKDENRPAEAQSIAGPACKVETDGPLHDMLTKLQLCP